MLPWFRERVKKLEQDPSYDCSDWREAMKRALLWGDEIPIGTFFQGTDLPSLDQAEPVLDHRGPLAHRELRIASPAAIKVTGNVVVDYHIRSSIEGWMLPRWRQL